MTTTTVMNLATGHTLTFVGCSPKDAVLSAYAQGRGDWATWLYEERYANVLGRRVTEDHTTWLAGDYSAVERHG